MVHSIPLASLPQARHRFTIIAHRADHVQAPENSLAAIDSAIVHGADYVELDLRTSADSQLFIMHDASINRTTNGMGDLSKLSSTLLDTVHLKNSLQTVPRFDSCLQHCRGKIYIYLDFKNAAVQQTLAMLEKYDCNKSVLVYINHPDQYTAWRKHAPNIPLIISLPDSIKTAPQLISFCRQYPAEVLDGDFSSYSTAMVAAAGRLGIKVWPDIQGPAENNNWPAALLKGFGGLQTDHPTALAEWLHANGKR